MKSLKEKKLAPPNFNHILVMNDSSSVTQVGIELVR